jgi:hypothetical protein
MSDIKKCDRCGKTYEYDFSDKPTDTETRYLTTITLNAKDLWNHEYHKTYDLCADCCASLMKWLNFDMAEERKD